jgi:hypothetical protein
MTIEHLEYLESLGVYQEELAKDAINAVLKSVTTRMPLLLYGPPGCGKTMSVYFVARKYNAEVIEINGSDDLKLQKNETRLSLKVREKHKGVRIILLDEIESNSNLRFLIKLVHLNKITAMETNTVIIATTNTEWKLDKFKIRVEKGGNPVSLMDVFGSYKQRVKQPDSRVMAKHVRRILGKKKLDVKVPRDLRYMEKIGDSKIEHHDKAANFDSSFELFKNYMQGPIKNRPKNLPTAKEMGGAFQKWLLVNTLSEDPQSFVKKNQSEFFRILEIISLAGFYGDNNLYRFLPEFTMYFNSYKHPSTILRSSKA